MIKNIIVKYSAYIIAYLSISGYFLAYKYKEGYYVYFNIPIVYINTIDFIDIIKMVSAIVAFLSMGIYIILTQHRKSTSEKETWIGRINKNATTIVILLLVAGHFDQRVIRGLSLILILLILIYNLILPLIFNRKIKGYNNKIAAFFKYKDDKGFMEILEHKIKYQFFALVLAVIFLTYIFGYFVFFLGYQNAKNIEVYDVTEIEGVKHIVFNVNDDKVIAASVINKTLSNEFSFHSKSELLIRKEEIQKLKVD